MFREKFPVPEAWANRAWADESKYLEMYQRSIDDPDGFWGEEGKRLDWIEPYTQISDVSYDTKDLHVKWYADGVLNASANCIDRHLAARGDQTAIIWEGDDPKDDAKLSYNELHAHVCRFANGLKSLGVRKGDRVTIYLPMIPEIAIAMLACARIGAVHSVVFGGFSPDSIAGRIDDCASTLVITSYEGLRGGRTIPLKDNVDQAIAKLPNGQVRNVVVVNRTGAAVNWVADRDIWYHELCEAQSTDCAPEPMSAEDPLFILYTSGSTGKPKGVLHTTGGYMVYASMTHQYVFDYHDSEIYWCTADCGWITGHSYIVYGPLSNGATTLIFEGLPNYPDASRHWEICDKHQVNIYYTAPTAIRALMREGDEPVKKTS
ncbi:MAG TPA: acetyl-coenzyme A synthetase, partial [Rhodospirillaceae bacterium]|nr:acetyl-coenzyme A synthetase [Rhodospirillaceae bacterium]